MLDEDGPDVLGFEGSSTVKLHEVACDGL